MHNRYFVAAGVAAMAWAISAPALLAGDGYDARSRLVAGRAVAVNFSFLVADLHTATEAARKKYGPDAKTVMRGGKIETTVNGKVMETSLTKARIHEVFGMLMVGPRRNAMARFPFSLPVSGKGERERDVGRTVRARFAKQAPHLFDFNDFDWVNLWCWPQATPDAGATFADAEPRLGKAELCLVRWRRDEPKTMLIGALAADGGDFVRDASRPICRALVEKWLDMPEVAGRDGFVDYAACVLVHDPDRGALGARETVVEHMYEVRPDHSLLTIN